MVGRVVVVLTVLSGMSALSGQEPIEVGDRLQLLWDDAVVDTARTTATRVLHRPEYAGDVMTCGSRWEGDSCGFFNILTDEDEGVVLYRMYYIAWNVGKEPNKPSPFASGRRVCYAESRDGIVWTKPNLGICTFGKKTENNIIVDCEKFNLEVIDNFMVMKDPRPSCPPAERYKAVSLDFRRDEKKRPHADGLACFVSPDGIHFSRGWKLGGVGPRSGVRGDTLNCVFFEPRLNKFVLYGRGLHTATNGSKREGKEGVRDIRRTESSDFRTWSRPESIRFAADAEDYALYTNMVEPYFREPSVYTGLPTRYVENPAWTDAFTGLCGVEARRRRMKDAPRYGLALTDCVFMSSRDGRTFERCDEAFLTPGPERPFAWVYGDCYPARGIVLTPGRRGVDPEMSFYVPFGQWFGQAAKLERFCLRQDGFISRHGAYRPQTLVTKPLVFAGDRMLLNFATSARGSVTVTVRSADGKAIVSEPFFGDKVDREVLFKGGTLAAFAGRTATVEFVLSDADVYSFRFTKTSPKSDAR